MVFLSTLLKLTSSSTGQTLAVIFYAQRRIKAAFQNLRGELSVMRSDGYAST